MTKDKDPQRRAKQIHNLILDITGSAMMTGNYQAFAEMFVLPQVIDTYDGITRLDSDEDVRRLFNSMRRHFRTLGVTELVRHSTNAEFINGSTIHATHESRLLNGTVQVQDAYVAYSILKLDDGIWKVADSQYAVNDENMSNAVRGIDGR